jgi:hypothetical protein
MIKHMAALTAIYIDNVLSNKHSIEWRWLSLDAGTGRKSSDYHHGLGDTVLRKTHDDTRAAY